MYKHSDCLYAALLHVSQVRYTVDSNLILRILLFVWGGLSRFLGICPQCLYLFMPFNFKSNNKAIIFSRIQLHQVSPKYNRCSVPFPCGKSGRTTKKTRARH